MKIYFTILFVALSAFLSDGLFAQIKPFHSLTSKDDAAFFKNSKNFLRSVRLHKIDVAALRGALINAPVEGKSFSAAIPVEIPMPDGSSASFDLVESPLLAPAVAKQFPEIKTYSGRSRTNKNMNISLSITSSGLSAIILNTDQGPVYIEKVTGAGRIDRYRSYYTKDAIVPWSNGIQRIQCLANEKTHPATAAPQTGNEKPSSARTMANIEIGNNTVGTQYRTFRLAVAVTGEFTKKHGNSKTQAFSDIIAYINRVNAIYKNELSVNFTVVSDLTIVYDDPATDPYTGTDTNLMLTKNQPEMNTKIGAANYDLGMVVSATFPGEEGRSSSGGGIASLASLGVDDSKAMNAMEEGDWVQGGNSYSQTYTDQVFAHEIGHQFGMPHTFNSSLGTCTNNGSAVGNVEPGSGTTIMSYGYTCSSGTANDDYGDSGLPNGPILNFHAGSFASATTYLNTIPSVGTTTETVNTPPVVTVPATSYTIPKSTPFALTGSATDANADALTYNWEGIDIGNTATPDATVFADDSKPPFFRSYAPSAAGNTRNYPILSAILNGTNKTKGEKLPSVTFATTHRLTVRDNNAVGGGVSSKDVTVNVDGNIGPFLIVNDLTGSHVGKTNKNIEWSVNGTNAATPNVKISLSTDGGQTFPTVLAASVPNSGSASVTLPNVATATARIKVEAVGNIFFDLSNQNFAITSALPVTLISFNGEEIEKEAVLNWQTANEANASHFEVERSIDVRNFQKIGRVEAAGNSSVLKSYSFKDKQFANLASVTYYRIRSVDIDGTFSNSRIISLNSGEILSLKAYPNPVKAVLTVDIHKTQLGSKAILSTISGITLRKIALNQERVTIDMTPYNAGLYLLRMADGSVVKLVKE